MPELFFKHFYSLSFIFYLPLDRVSVLLLIKDICLIHHFPSSFKQSFYIWRNNSSNLKFPASLTISCVYLTFEGWMGSELHGEPGSRSFHFHGSRWHRQWALRIAAPRMVLRSRSRLWAGSNSTAVSSSGRTGYGLGALLNLESDFSALTMTLF